jgi:hypothetical protein
LERRIPTSPYLASALELVVLSGRLEQKFACTSFPELGYTRSATEPHPLAISINSGDVFITFSVLNLFQ